MENEKFTLIIKGKEQNERIIKIFNKKTMQIKEYKLKDIKPIIKSVDYKNKTMNFDLAFYGDFIKTSNLNDKISVKSEFSKRNLFFKNITTLIKFKLFISKKIL